MTSLRLNPKFAAEAAKVTGAKSRTEAVHLALHETADLKRFKNLMKKYGGKLSFRHNE